MKCSNSCIYLYRYTCMCVYIYTYIHTYDTHVVYFLLKLFHCFPMCSFACLFKFSSFSLSLCACLLFYTHIKTALSSSGGVGGGGGHGGGGGGGRRPRRRLVPCSPASFPCSHKHTNQDTWSSMFVIVVSTSVIIVTVGATDCISP